MKKVLVLSVLFLLLSTPGASHPQQRDSVLPNAAAQNETALKPDVLVEEWFGRLNNLDDWFIAPDGKEQNDVVVDRVLELFGDDAYLEVGPWENQIGTVRYHGRDAIRTWIDRFSRSYLDLNYRVHFKTKAEKTAKPVYIFESPWGETMVAVEFAAVHTVRRDRLRFWMPGAAFFTYDKGGKIQNLRLYILRDEREETKTYTSM